MNRLSAAKLAVTAISAILLGVATLPAEANPPTAHPSGPTTFPFNAAMTRVLGFRAQPSLTAPAAIPGHEYIGAGAHVHVVDATGVPGTQGTFCQVEYQNKHGYIRCDDMSAFQVLAAVPPPPPHAGSLHHFCDSVASCKTFCEQSCTLNQSSWTTSCPNIPTSGAGMIASSSQALSHIPAMRFVTASSEVRATQEVIAGLKRLDDHLAANHGSGATSFKAHVTNCYRSAASDSARECDYILKGWHIKSKWQGKEPQTQSEKNEKANGERFVDPNKLGLAWPGASYHSSGNACDIVLADSEGHDAMSCAYSPQHTYSRHIDQHTASKLLDEALTNDTVGARRLNFEAWHYEWGGTTDCRCKGAECEKYWPPGCGAGSNICAPHTH